MINIEGYTVESTDNPMAIDGIMSIAGLVDALGGVKEMRSLKNKLLKMKPGEELLAPKVRKKVIRTFLLFKGYNMVNSSESSMFRTKTTSVGRVKIIRRLTLESPKLLPGKTDLMDAISILDKNMLNGEVSK